VENALIHIEEILSQYALIWAVCALPMLDKNQHSAFSVGGAVVKESLY